MIITTKTTVSFKIPDELGEAKMFEWNNDLEKWHLNNTTYGALSYTKIETVEVKFNPDIRLKE